MRRPSRIAVVAAVALYAACAARFAWVVFILRRAELTYRTRADMLEGAALERLVADLLTLRETKLLWGAVLVALPVAFMALGLALRWALQNDAPSSERQAV